MVEWAVKRRGWGQVAAVRVQLGWSDFGAQELPDGLEAPDLEQLREAVLKREGTDI